MSDQKIATATDWRPEIDDSAGEFKALDGSREATDLIALYR
jgi:hypothetical protein